MTVIRAALDEMFAVIGQMVGSVFRHGLPLTDKIAARTALTNFFLHIHPVRVRRPDGCEGKSSDRKSTRLNSSHGYISYAVFCLKKKKQQLSPNNTANPL